jgi:hypothetical protein
VNKSIIAAAAFSLIAGSALAQSMTETKTTTTTTISPADETQMREYIVKEHPAPIAPPAGFTVTTGAVLPESVNLYNFPAERPWGHYSYTVIGDQRVLVDPATRRVVEIIR